MTCRKGIIAQSQMRNKQVSSYLTKYCSEGRHTRMILKIVERHDNPTDWTRQLQQYVPNVEEHLIHIIFFSVQHSWALFSKYHELTQQRAEEMFAFDYT